MGKAIVFHLKPTNSGDGLHPLEILHEIQIWRNILDNLKHPDDLKSCVQVCTFFRDELQSKRVMFLLDEVLIIMRKQSMVVNNDYLNCRLVCKSWLLGINEVLKNIPHFGMFNFCSPEEMELFRSKFFPGDNNNAGENPIFSKSISIWQPMNPDLFTQRSSNEILRNLRAAPIILGIIGHNITKLQLRMFQPAVSLQIAEEMYPLLRNMLTLLPNLEYFQLHYGVMIPHIYWSNHYKIRHAQATSSEPLRGLITEYPLPEMRKLKKLEMFSISLSEDILLELLQKCPQLLVLYDSNRLDVGNIGLLSKTVMGNVQNIDHPCLQEFKGDFCSRLDYYLTLCNFQWPNLKTVNLCISKPIIPNDILNVDTIFKVLEYHKESLNEVGLILENGSIDYWDTLFCKNHKYKYDLPNLQIFKFKYQETMPLDFILPMKRSLKTLCLWPVKSVSEMLETELGKAALKIYRCWNNMYDSNVWNVFPQLETVELKSPHAHLPTDSDNVIRPPITTRYTRHIYKRKVGEEKVGRGKSNEKNYWQKFLSGVKKCRKLSATVVAEVMNLIV